MNYFPFRERERTIQEGNTCANSGTISFNIGNIIIRITITNNNAIVKRFFAPIVCFFLMKNILGPLRPKITQLIYPLFVEWLDSIILVVEFWIAFTQFQIFHFRLLFNPFRGNIFTKPNLGFLFTKCQKQQNIFRINQN